MMSQVVIQSSTVNSALDSLIYLDSEFQS
ncbi:hypothetical protein VCHENC02_0420A, partial [Vibrio harveyi]